jgi:hypothetical protein
MITAHLPTHGGVYFIKNTLNEKLYIGFSGNIQHKIHDHSWRLRSNNHHSRSLQDDWNLDNLCWECGVIELTLDDTRERFWILEYGSHITGYNTSIGRNPSEGTKLLIQSKLKGRISPTKGTTRPIDAIIRTADKNRGRKRSDEFCELMSLRRRLTVHKKMRSQLLRNLRNGSSRGSKLIDEINKLSELICNSEKELIDFETIYYKDRGSKTC